MYKGAKNLEDAGLEKFIQKGMLVEKGKVVVDHINPVIPIEGFPNKTWDWNIYIERMFCDTNNLQVLCKECHDGKTKLEKQMRKKNKC